MKVIAGLGNPGLRYASTRHNCGFRVLEALAERFRIPFNRSVCNALWGQGRIGTEDVILTKPLTYMNRSGESIVRLLGYLGLNADQLLVIYDDVALPLGRLRLRPEGSAGGHNGLGSIIEHIGTEKFPRLRIGVGSPAPDTDLADYVLTDFSSSEEAEIKLAIAEAVWAVELFLEHGLTMAMNKVNAPQ